MKSKLLKKLFSIMLVGTVVCNLAACGGKEEQGDGRKCRR